MKRTKRIAALLVVVLVMSMLPMNAFAKKAKVKGNVPTAGTVYEKYEGAADYKEVGSFTSSYDKAGKINTYTYTPKVQTSGHSKTIKYQWKGDLLAKVTSTYTYYGADETGDRVSSTTVTSYSYKNKLVSKVVSKTTNVYLNEPAKVSGYTSTYTWKKGEALVKTVSLTDGTRSVSTSKVNSKKQQNSSWEANGKVTYKNGLVAKVTGSRKGTLESYSWTTTYNKYGYPVKSVTNDNDEDSISAYTWTYNHVMSGTCPSITEMVYTSTSTNKKTGAVHTWSESTKAVYTAFASVSQIRNCDAYGHGVPLGYDGF